MLILFPQRTLSRALRAIATLLALGIMVSFFVGGAHPVAGNLIPAPWDKLAHGVIFASLAWAIGIASELPGCRRTALALFGSLLIGVLDEWHQIYLPGRQPGWPDLAADAVGSIVGAALLAMERIKRSQHHDSS